MNSFCRASIDYPESRVSGMLVPEDKSVLNYAYSQMLAGAHRIILTVENLEWEYADQFYETAMEDRRELFQE